jgi:hypothetical protein
MEAFEQQQLRSVAFIEKGEEEIGQIEKRSNRRLVRDVCHRRHFCCFAGVCYQFLHIADFEITALILNHHVF